MILTAILSVLDLIAGSVILIRLPFLFFLMGVILLFKGIWSLFSSVIIAKYYFDWMGVVDVLGGVSLLLMNHGHFSSIFGLIGIIVLVKGIYSLFTSVTVHV